MMTKKTMRNLSAQMPKVSIGMPVWNGEDFIREALDSLLAQDFKDFELNIVDNGSIDKTKIICKQYAKKDKRIKYYRNENNIGAQANFKKALELATAPYFMWASHDDLWDKSYISKMVAILDTHKPVIIAGSNSASVDEKGRPLEYYDVAKMYSPQSRYARAYRLICASPEGGYATLIYGLMRTSVIKRIGLVKFGEIREYNRGKYATDKLTLFRLLFEGDFFVLDETLYFHRDIVVKKDYKAHVRLFKKISLSKLSHILKRGVDFYGYYNSLRRIVFASDLRIHQKMMLMLVSIAQEIKFYVVYYTSFLVRLFS